MSYSQYSHPYNCKLWYPSGVAYEDATYSLELKSPEVGNTIIEGRKQTITRAASGNVVVTDLGLLINPQIDLQFKSVPEVERAALSIFLHAIQFAVNRFAYQDYSGTIRTVRLKESSIQYTDTGLHNRADTTTQLWDFGLSLLDVTDNPSEYDGGIMPSALALHIASITNPHNPMGAERLSNIVSGYRKVGEFKTIEGRSAYVTVEWRSGVNVHAKSLFVNHDRDGATIATNSPGYLIATLNSGSMSGNVLFGLDGTGDDQIVEVLADTNTDTTYIRSKVEVN